MSNYINAVEDQIRLFVRLAPLASDPQVGKRIRDEFDLFDALDAVATFFHDTERMVGLRMYRGQDFDPVEDVKRNMEELLLNARNQKDVIGVRHRNLIMYHLVVEPVINSFNRVDHRTVLSQVDHVVEAIKQFVTSIELNSHIDDARVALEQVRSLVREREAIRKSEIQAKRKTRRPRTEDVSNDDYVDVVNADVETEELYF